MSTIARILLLIKIFGIALGVLVVSITFRMQREATETADSQPTLAIELNVAKPPANATEPKNGD